MWQERQGGLLRDEIETVLSLLPESSDLRDLARQPLTKAGRGLSAQSQQGRPWSLLPLLVCQGVCGRFEPAVPAAAALQFFMAAGDVFDDIEDNDSSESLSAECGRAVATNVATALLILAERAILRLKEGDTTDDTVIRTIQAANAHYTTACAGQHLDLRFGSDTTLTEEIYLKINSMKSASQIECACHVGALVANAEQKIIDRYSEFGHNLGMAAQITNDIQGITQGGDIAKRKITLPVIYALAASDATTRGELEEAFDKQCKSPPDTARVRELLFRTGAIYYTIVKMECYKQQTLDILADVDLTPNTFERLKLFLE